jgi:hypothetical protein
MYRERSHSISATDYEPAVQYGTLWEYSKKVMSTHKKLTRRNKYVNLEPTTIRNLKVENLHLTMEERGRQRENITIHTAEVVDSTVQ